MRAFLVFVATVVIALAVAMPNTFRETVHYIQHWISWAVGAIF